MLPTWKIQAGTVNITDMYWISRRLGRSHALRTVWSCLDFSLSCYSAVTKTKSDNHSEVPTLNLKAFCIWIVAVEFLKAGTIGDIKWYSIVTDRNSITYKRQVLNLSFPDL
jgi:hypothetical protein